MKKIPGDPCPYCSRKLTKRIFFEKEMRRRAAIKESLATSDSVGRPRTIDYNETIITL